MGNVFDNSLFGRPGIKDDTGTFQSDWKAIIDNGTLVRGTNSGSNTTVELYEVPAGKIFYLVSAFLQLYSTTTAQADGFFDFNGEHILALRTVGAASVSEAVSAAFNIPMKLLATQKLRFNTNNAGATAVAGFAGYELNG